MARYKLYLLRDDGRMVGKKEFNAMRNFEAVEVGARLAEASGEKYSSYEVWRANRKIIRRKRRQEAAD